MADEFKIVASLNIPESASRINKDIPKLEGQAKHLKIVADLNPTLSIKNIQATLNKMNNNANIKIGVDVGGLNSVQGATQNITNGLKSVQTQAQQTANSIHEISTQMDNFKFPVVTMRDKDGNTITDTVKTLQNARDMFSKLGFTNVKFTWADEAGGVFDRLTAKVTDSYGAVQNFKFALLQGSNDYTYDGAFGTDSGVEKLITSMQKAQDKVKALRTNLTAELKSIRSAWQDVNGGKSVKSDENIERLKQQYIKVTQAIRELRNADDTTLASMKANADAQIDKLNQMVTQYHNAEKVATQLRAKGFETVKIDTGNNIDKFINSINNSKVPIQAMQTEINKLTSDFAQLDTIQDQAGKSAALTNILNTLDNAKTKFQSLKVMYQSIGNYDKQLDKLAQDWQKQGIYVGNVQTTVENLKKSLANVSTANGLTNWVNDFKTQIGAINEMPIKVMECKQKIAETSKEWYKQGILVKDVAQEMSAFKQSLSLVSSSGEIEQWNKNWDSFIQMVAQAKGNLDKQVESYNNIYSIQAKIAKLNPTKDSAEIARLNEKLSAEQKTLSNLQMQSNVYSNLVSLEQQEQYITEQTVKSRDKLLSATNTGVKQYQTTITNAITELQGIANSAVFRNNASNPQVTQTKQDINSLITAYQNLATKLQGNITPAGLETVRTELTQLNARFNDATTTAKRFETELRNDNGAEKQAQRVALLKAQIEAYAKANPKAMKQFGDAFNNMITTLNSSPDKITVDRVAKQFQTLRQEINKADLAGKNLWQTFEEKSKKFIGWMSMTFLYSSMFRAFRSAITNVIELDKAMTNLKKVTDETDTTYAKFLNNASTQAKELHSTITDLVEQTAVWAKLGYSLNEAQNLATTSMIYSKVGEVENSKSVSDLVTVMKAFNIESEKSIRIVDSLNELGNNFATSAADLGEGLTKSASALQVANNSFEQSIALLTGGTEITQNANEMGSALKVISMRIRGKKYMPPYKESLYAVLRLKQYTEDNYICQMVMGHQRRRKDLQILLIY